MFLKTFKSLVIERGPHPLQPHPGEKNYWLGCWPLVEISKHKQANSTSLAYNQKPQPQLQQNGQAVVLGQWQNFQPSNLAGPAGRPSPNVEISATVQAPLLGHIVAAMVVASDGMPAILHSPTCAGKFRLAEITGDRQMV